MYMSINCSQSSMSHVSQTESLKKQKNSEARVKFSIDGTYLATLDLGCEGERFLSSGQPVLYRKTQ